jgi:hypothetical protein
VRNLYTYRGANNDEPHSITDTLTNTCTDADTNRCTITGADTCADCGT